MTLDCEHLLHLLTQIYSLFDRCEYWTNNQATHQAGTTYHCLGNSHYGKTTSSHSITKWKGSWSKLKIKYICSINCTAMQKINKNLYTL